MVEPIRFVRRNGLSVCSAAVRGVGVGIGLAPFPYSVVGGILPLKAVLRVLSRARLSVPVLPVLFGVSPFLYNTTLLAYASATLQMIKFFNII